MALPLLLPLLGAGLGIGIGRAQDRQQQVRQQQARDQMGQDARSQIAAAGFDITPFEGPRVGLDPAQQRRMQGIQQGLMSPSPNVQDFAQAELQRFAQDQGVATPMADLYQAGADQQAQQTALRDATIKAEIALNKTFRSETSGIRQGLRAIQLAQSAIMEDNPTSRLNVARLAIQQLDQSMITNPEIANLLAQQGLQARLKDFIDWASGDGMITGTRAQEFLNSMEALGQVYQTQLDAMAEQTRQLIGTQYNERGIPVNADNVLTLIGDNAIDLGMPDVFPGGTGTEGVGTGTATPTDDPNVITTTIEGETRPRRLRRN